MSDMHKELRNLRRIAESQNWTVNDDGPHIKWYPPEGSPNIPESGFITTSRTPSDEGIIKTIKNDFERCGLIIDKTEYKRQQSQKTPLVLPNLEDKVPRSKENMLIAKNCTDEQLLAVLQDKEPVLFETSPPKLLAMLCNLMRTYDQWYTHCNCGRQFENAIPLYTHTIRENELNGSQYKDHHYPISDNEARSRKEQKEKDLLALANAPVPTPEPTKIEVPVERNLKPVVLRIDTTDEELFDILEMLLDQPVTLNRNTFTVVQDWMESTRKLLKLKEQ